MSPEEVRDALRSYNSANARIAFLKEEAEEIRRGIELENRPETQAIHAQKYTGIPSANPDPITERVVLGALEGRYTSDAIRWEKELHRLEAEIRQTGRYPRLVDIWLSALTDKERAVIIAHEIELMSWEEIAIHSTKLMGTYYSVSGLRKIGKTAMTKIYNVAR